MSQLANGSVKHQAARLGAVTHSANNYETSEMVDGGALVKRTLRDSTAERPQYKKKKNKRPATCASPKAAMPSPSGAVDGPSSRDPEFALDERAEPHRCALRVKVARTVGAAAIAGQRKRRAPATSEALQAEAADESRVAAWIASRSLTQRAGPAASERMSALRARLRCSAAS